MFQAILECAAAAACSTMSPNAEQPENLEPPTTEAVADTSLEDVSQAALEAEVTPTAETDSEATPETNEQTAPEGVINAEGIVVVSNPVVQQIPTAAIQEMVAAYPAPRVLTAEDAREVECLALNIYHEARGEPTRGRYAVAWVTINRMQAEQFPDTVCDVVYQTTTTRRGTRVAQFSWVLQNPAEPYGTSWNDAQRIAHEVYEARNNTSGAQRLSANIMYYHATSGVSRRNLNWFQSALNRIETIGRHIFYSER